MANPSTNVPPEEQPLLPEQHPQEHSPKLVQSPGTTSASSYRQPQLDQSPKSPKPDSKLGIPTSVLLSPGRNPTSATKHPTTYRGVRSRRGKWVSEIREQRKTTRIWLGTYPTPEMAATAYDVAAIALKGPNTELNFPDMILSYPQVASTSATDIQTAAAQAAAARLPKPKTSKEEGKSENEGTSTTTSTKSSSCMEPSASGSGQEYIDEEELLNFPNLMVDMAEGMLVNSPSWINSPPSNDSPDNSDVENLWNYP
ncbi:hypothetical protein V6N13_021700 [Hibiscus sabdariffa]|uniref:AP2/ERF domain-containing protein n=1 Tax=Hibiscus sabdariffa TaxID=183260 RepID=A0ABR2BBT9_9ROSI